MSTPTFEEYSHAQEIVHRYEKERDRLYQIKVQAFDLDLKKYFAENLIDGVFRLEKYKLEDGKIIPINPSLEEMYDGGNNADIKLLCEKHDVNFKFIYWCYHK